MSARDKGIAELSLPDMERRVANMVRYGKVSQVDLTRKRVKVTSGNITTGWVAWPAGRAAAGKIRWDSPEVGEQVALICPAGDLRQACVIPGLYQEEFDAPVTDANKDHVTYGDGTVVEYDRGSHTLKADLGPSKITATREQIKLEIGGTSITASSSALTLVAGGSSIVLDAAGVSINGAAINLNS